MEWVRADSLSRSEHRQDAVDALALAAKCAQDTGRYNEDGACWETTEMAAYWHRNGLIHALLALSAEP